ncbi:transcriptional regulator GlnR [Paucilactobacillus oligofermentans DSM 15707 = LMG 22743]|uniref:Transcriptional regulator GlnR n=1 Tax=Paucilactobacillus oligofermentans DSM 15707 = LMG 22743 TaxID=1423778 RepID=A0A0R1RRW2_9LACO|nr:MerR family transcriptional regulator [Paucilactobacillus oligofermentans]KRL55928.1 transcriptional regulator GlnR [Paucilactobacillus oligofermentans DSM 15707 = LMG 22743]CUS26091.1 Putative HTH-type transcriptional regulator GlnR [Paucilactobacillus oligofermentans DSM 15707 = LMG 22743]
MKEKELRRSLAVLPIGTVMKLTNLTARQIRYYESQDLIKPERSDGNRRLYSLNDIDRLLEIKDYIDDGLNMAGIRKVFTQKQLEQEQFKERLNKSLTDDDVRKILHDELLRQSGFRQVKLLTNSQTPLQKPF